MPSPPTHYQDVLAPEPSALQPVTTVTRTVAIIKTHSLKHRFGIEPRILEAGFEIVKERQMEFDTESDPEFLVELFGDDAHSLAEGPVWVYVLERRRAVEVWNALIGDPDPIVARENSPNSLRALYGISLEQNGLMGSPDIQMAETQIASLFASSPPFPTSELPEDLSHPELPSYNRTHSVDSIGRSSLHRATSNPSSVGGTSANGKPLFRARPLPKTHDAPDIAPRTTKAAVLRALGEKTPSTRWTPHTAREIKTKAEQREAFMNVPGHKRAESIAVASTAAPAIAPRMTKAASLRISKDALKLAPRIKQSTSAPVVPKAKAKTANGNENVKQPAKNTFEGVPGHKRRETISVASTAEPVVAPRQNRSAALRAQKDTAPPSAFLNRASSQTKAPGISRSTSQTCLSPPRTSSRPASVASGRPSRTSSALSVTSPTSAGSDEDKPKKRRPMSLQAPSIAPRPNKSAMLRAAKKEEKSNKGVFV